MGLKARLEMSTGAPDGQSSWDDEGDGFTLQNHSSVSAGVSANLLTVQTVTQADLQLAGGQPSPDVLALGAPIQRLNGCQITLTALLAAATTMTLAITVYRTAKLAVAAASGVAITSITLDRPLASSMPSGQTIVLTNAAGNTQSVTTSAAVATGQTVIPINSVTPGNTYAIGSFANFQVGNMPCFGWLYNPGGGFSGVSGSNGTPLFPANVSLSMPAIAANTALVTPTGGTGSYLMLCPGDSIQVLIQTSGGSVSIPVGNLQPLMV